MQTDIIADAAAIADVILVGSECEALHEATAEALVGAWIETFAEAGILTNDAGFVLHLNDDSEYQITIVRRR